MKRKLRLMKAAPLLYECAVDALGMVECNCGYTAADGPGCDGTCLHGMLTKAIAMVEGTAK